MKLNLPLIVLAAAAFSVSAPAIARDAATQAAREVIDLKDGSTLYVFKDGKMAKEDRYGRATSLQSGEVLEASDSRKVTAVGNEVARLNSLLGDGHRR